MYTGAARGNPVLASVQPPRRHGPPVRASASSQEFSAPAARTAKSDEKREATRVDSPYRFPFILMKLLQLPRQPTAEQLLRP